MHGLDNAFALPLDVMRNVLSALNTTESADGGRYWHVHLNETPAGEIALLLPKQKATLPVSRYALALAT
jgi:hypothetical protein